MFLLLVLCPAGFLVILAAKWLYEIRNEVRSLRRHFVQEDPNFYRPTVNADPGNYRPDARPLASGKTFSLGWAIAIVLPVLVFLGLLAWFGKPT